MKYEKRPTQEDRILQLLTEKPEGVYIYELSDSYPRGLGIKQYNARIWGLRQRGLKITDDHGHFVLHREPKQESLFPASPGYVQGNQSYRYE